MNGQTPKPARRVRRGIFHKLGESINKLEQNLTHSPSILSRDSQLSFSSTSENSYFEDQHEQDDSDSIPESPKPQPSNISLKNNR